MGCIVVYAVAWAVGLATGRLLLGPSWWRIAATLKCGLGIVLGSIYAGLATFWAVVLLPSYRGPAIGAAMTIGLVVGVAVLSSDARRRARPRGAFRGPGRLVRAGWWAGASVFAALIVLTSIRGLDVAVLSPEGHWDACAIWMNRARFYLRAPLDWTRAADPELEWAQPEYPSLLASLVVYGWLPSGRCIALAPAIVAISMQVGLLLTIVGLSRTAFPRSPWPWVLGIFYAAVPNQWDPRLAWECADRPLAALLLAGVGSLALALRLRGRRWLLVAGLSLGSAAFCKNEGKAALVLLSLGAAGWMIRGFCRGRAARRSAIRDIACLAAGLAPGIASLGLQFACSPLSPQMIRNLSSRDLVDSGRTLLIARSAWSQFIDPSWGGFWAGVALTLIGLGIWLRRPGTRLFWAAASAQLFVYLAFFQVTPLPLAWQLETALPRLMMHVGPLFLLASGWLALDVERDVRREPPANRVSWRDRRDGGP